jgi:hypothetical protein
VSLSRPQSVGVVGGKYAGTQKGADVGIGVVGARSPQSEKKRGRSVTMAQGDPLERAEEIYVNLAWSVSAQSLRFPRPRWVFLEFYFSVTFADEGITIEGRYHSIKRNEHSYGDWPPSDDSGFINLGMPRLLLLAC